MLADINRVRYTDYFAAVIALREVKVAHSRLDMNAKELAMGLG